MTDKKKNTTTSKRPGRAKRLGRTVRRLNQGLSSVHETTRLLTAPMELQQVLELVVQTVAEALAVDAAGLRLLDEENDTLVLKATFGLSDEYKNKGPVTAAESILNRRALAGVPVVVDDMRTDTSFRRYHDHVVSEGVISSLSIGLRYHDKGIGILRLYSKKPRSFSENDISVARTVASQSAAAIINARLYGEALEGERMARQLRLAGAVQRHLIPVKPPILPGFDIAGVYVPCYDVGGDFYDFIMRGERRVVIAIGDVMGKGVPASLAMAALRSGLRAYAEYVADIAALARHANRMFCDDSVTGEFATLFCAGIDLATAKMTYCNCGHNPPLLIRDGSVIELSGGGTVLGITNDSEYDAQAIELRLDDMLVMYTDGLTDAVNFEREPFGITRVKQAALSSAAMAADMTAAQVAGNILWLMRKFTGLTQRFDDTAIVVIKRTDPVK